MLNLKNLKTTIGEICKPLKLLFFFLILLTPTYLHALPKIAICQIVEHPALNVNYQGILAELKDQGLIPDDSVEIVYENAQGNTLLLGQIAQKLAGLGADVYVAIGTQSAQSLMSALKSSEKPLVFTAITDPREAKLVQNYAHPEGNVTGVADATDLEPQFELFKTLVPHLKKLGVIYNPGEANSLASLKLQQKAAAKMGLEIVPAIATKTSEVSGAARSLVGRVDAYFVDNDNTALAAFEAIVKVGLENQMPAFVSDTDMVERGALAALGPNQYDLGRETGEMVVRILNGTSPSEIPVAFPKRLETVINEKMAKQLGIQIPAGLNKHS